MGNCCKECTSFGDDKKSLQYTVIACIPKWRPAGVVCPAARHVAEMPHEGCSIGVLDAATHVDSNAMETSVSGCGQAQQWVDEVREKAPQLRVALYHGSKRRSFTPALLACHDVIVTTYQTMANEWDAAPQGALFRVRWHRCASFGLWRLFSSFSVNVHKLILTEPP